MATYSEMMDAILDFMDETYRNINTLYNSRGYRYRHIDVREIYAFLAGRFPDESIRKCFDLMQDLYDFCSQKTSVYPYPDGEYWTAEELDKYTAWRDNFQ